MDFLETTIKELIKNKVRTLENLAKIKREIAKKYKIPCLNNISLLKTYHELIKKKKIKKTAFVELLLKTRPIRSLSGIVNVSVLTKPYPCPGKCLYCPIEKGIPKSYVSGEPAVERAKKLNFDPYWQTKKRIEMLEMEGHPTDKIELRIVGGTWSYYPRQYQIWFVTRCFAACNAEPRRTICRTTLRNLEKVQRLNEKVKHRIVGLSVETRPDFITESEIKHLRRLGVTMVELGVQSIYDDVLKINLRGHGIKETILATKLLKDAGFKVLYQLMPNLPGSNLKRDEKMFAELFKNPSFQPDLLKIYPCALLKEAPLYKLWKEGKYKPYSQSQLIKLVKSIKKRIPYYIRIQRISRDIPSPSIVSGPAKISNLRQILAKIIKKEGWRCKCIRCREIREAYDPKERIYLFREDYKASGGKEIFLSFENKNRTKLYSLLRLRITSQNKAIVREIHTYGQLHPLNQNCTGRTRVISPQHKGLGRKLIKEAEEIAKKEFGLNKIAVISGIGAREYFRKLRYLLEDTYMIKRF
ncbi:MAG: tRNA uridine(34) 5-carboxymethylaminomethyl modification radical SAM/GNAT enzyme Elp3 [Candidatus Nealsonbacteria bacterium]|nr:tRNA uridine(34) 5-carboxymethylaminomethyl modification radical SAM/GNAT enzyme Elp3 [Candidatus Nealsonbacteria bacterium]